MTKKILNVNESTEMKQSPESFLEKPANVLCVGPSGDGMSFKTSWSEEEKNRRIKEHKGNRNRIERSCERKKSCQKICGAYGDYER